LTEKRKILIHAMQQVSSSFFNIKKYLNINFIFLMKKINFIFLMKKLNYM